MVEGNMDWLTKTPFLIKNGVFITNNEVAGFLYRSI